MNSYFAIEDRITEALSSHPQNSKPNIAKLAREFAVPESRLRARAKGRATRSDRAAVNQRLTDAEEAALCRYLDVLEEAGLYARQRDITRVANSILWRRDETELPVSPAWATRFQKRHPQYFIRSQRALDIERKEAHNRKDIEIFFERWEAILKKYSVLPTDTYNFDETGFRIGMGRHQKIITRDPKAKVYIESSTNRDYVTVVETISADGNTIPPMVIMSSASHREHWVPPSVEDGQLYGTSESGYSNDQLALHWLRHFDHWTAKRQQGVYRLLLFDGHESHRTYEFLSYCDEKKIIPFTLPPHTTHFLQPLDVAVFSPMKYWHSQAVDDCTRTGGTNFSRAEFFHYLGDIRKRTFKYETIVKGWRVTRLIPIAPRPILAQLQYEEESREEWLEESRQCEEELRTPSPVSSSTINTPRTIRTVTRYGQKVLDGPELHSRFERRLEALVKSSITTTQLAAQLQSDIARSKAAEKAREQRRQSRRRIFQSGGVLYAHEARRIQKARDEDEVAQAEAAFQRAKDRQLRTAKAKAKRLAIDCKKHRRELLKRWKAAATSDS